MIATPCIGTDRATTQPSESTSTYIAQRRERLKWLLSQGLPPLPVAPFQDPYRYHKVVKASKGYGQDTCKIGHNVKFCKEPCIYSSQPCIY